jgi:hypothetical protein
MVECYPSPLIVDSRSKSEDNVAMEERILGEYAELPGLSLTVPQAARLFNLDMTRCSRLLEDLVLDGALWTNGDAFHRREEQERTLCVRFAAGTTTRNINCTHSRPLIGIGQSRTSSPCWRPSSNG